MSNLELDRRKFLQSSMLAGGLAVSGSASAGLFDFFNPIKFKHGVASGDPTQSSVIIWTRLTPRKNVDKLAVFWVVARDKACRHIVKKGFVETNSDKDYTVKVDVEGLEQNTRYYYKFLGFGKNNRLVSSPRGKTKTLPEGSAEAFKLAVFSCSNYPAGFFNVYGLAAQDRSIDAVLHLGDYIYEYGQGGYATTDAPALGRIPNPLHEIVSLEDYRKRYAQYRTDKNLQKLHRRLPFICVWDDHEVTNDTYDSGAENHNPEFGEGDFFSRREAALKAYYEWMPIREQSNPLEAYRAFEIGDLASLYMLDTRLVARDKQLEYANYIDPTTGSFNSDSFIADVSNPSRELLGSTQLQWLQSKMASSSSKWQILGQQVLMGRMNLPAAVATQQIGLAEYTQLATLAQTNPSALTPEQLSLLQLPSIPYNLDAWDGYAYEREVIFSTSQSLGKNLICLAGDTHNAWANNLESLNGSPIGVEFATAGVSSPGLEAFLPEDPSAVAAGVTQLIGPLQYANTADRGFLCVTLTEESVTADFKFVTTVKSENFSEKEEAAKTLKVEAGRNRIS